MRKNLHFYFILIFAFIFIFSISEYSYSKDYPFFSKAKNSIDCEDVPNFFSSYQQAYNIVVNANFNYSDYINTWKSSWIESAEYYSCDGQTGFFIIHMKNGTYIHQDLPVEIWYAFKNAYSFGSFYSTYIRGNYRVRLY